MQRKNRFALTPHYSITPQNSPVIDRQRPGRGFRHLVTKKQLNRFIELIPDWSELSLGLNAVVLASGEPGVFGWHRPGMVAICAWGADFEQAWSNDYIDKNREILECLGVDREPICSQYYEDSDTGQSFQICCSQSCKFTAATARAYQLMHVFLHELGHHHDRMTTKSQCNASRGETYADEYAAQRFLKLWPKYCDAFGWYRNDT